MEYVEFNECPACMSIDSKIWLKDKSTTKFVICNRCGSIYSNPRVSKAIRFNKLDQIFSYGKNSIKIGESRINSLQKQAEYIKQYISTGVILDIGCDLGDFFTFFPTEQWDKYGAEVSFSAAEYAEKKYQAKVFPGVITESNFPENFFHVVSMLDTIYYIDNPIEDLQYIHRLLKSNGVLAIEIPGVKYQMLRSNGMLSYLLEKKYSRISSDSTYVSWLSFEGMKIISQKTGFDIIKIFPIKTSMVQNRPLYTFLSNLYYFIVTKIPFDHDRYYDWFPKYLLILKKNES
jgi:SAM-dependent methyltransferase